MSIRDTIKAYAEKQGAALGNVKGSGGTRSLDAPNAGTPDP